MCGEITAAKVSDVTSTESLAEVQFRHTREI